MRQFRRYLPLLVLTLVSMRLGVAQSTIDINMGFGSAQDSAGGGLDANTTLACTASSLICAPTPSLNSFLLGFGANAILWKRFGIGGEANFQPTKQTYADLSTTAGAVLLSRATFYDFNGIFQPVNQEKVAVQLLGGIGGANMKFYAGSPAGSPLGNSVYSNYAYSSSNHFQVHGGLGVQLYVSGNFFIRPQFDVHYVPHLNQQFGRNLVTREAVWVGYSIGERQ